MPGDQELFGPEQLNGGSVSDGQKAQMFGPDQLNEAPVATAAEDIPLKDKPIPEQPGPMRMRQAFLRKQAPNLTERGISEANKTAAENAGMLVATEGAGDLLGLGLKSAAPFIEENVLPAIERGVPYAGRVLKFAEEAPSAVKAAVRGASTGAAYGGATGAFEGHPIRGALIGAGTGGLLGAGAYGIGRMARPEFENVPFAGESEPPITEGKPLVSETVNPPISVRRGPGEIAPERIAQPPGERVPPFPGRTNAELPGGGVIVRPQPLLPGKTISPMDALGKQIEQAAGTPPLRPNVRLRDQPFHAQPVGADVLVPQPRDPRMGVLPRTPIGSRVAVPVGEEFGPMAKGEGKFPVALTEEVGKQMGAAPSAESEAQMALEKKYPDKAVRQMVHANGARIVDAIGGDDPKTMREVHELTGPDLRQALINSGEDMGQTSIGSRKATGNQMSREQAFNKLLDKGLSPREIVKLARQR